VEPARSTFITTKAAIRRAAEAAGVPYTLVWTGYFFGYGLPGIGQAVDAREFISVPACYRSTRSRH